jgi:hypothetical protein
MKEIKIGAIANSSKAKEWVLNQMGNDTLRSRLDPSIQKLKLTNEQLLERFAWEFERLPIMHNAPLNELDATEIPPIIAQDDTRLDVSLGNGFIQNPCQRFLVGESETLGSTRTYTSFFSRRFHMRETDYPTGYDATASLRNADNCMVFNANNLRKISLGNVNIYGGMTYVLNKDLMKSRFFYEAWDAGITEMLYTKTALGTYPGLGIKDNWYHLVQPHVELFNLPYPAEWGPIPGCCNYSLADTFNRWWVPGTPPQTSGMFQTNPYYEVMAIGNPWLPEDLLYGITKFGEGVSVTTGVPQVRHNNMWGEDLGTELVKFLQDGKRPLIWGRTEDGAMVIDPVVAQHVPGLGEGRVTDDAVALFKTHWNATFAKGLGASANWQALLEATPVALHFYLPTWANKTACEQYENNATRFVIGTDGMGACVFWDMDPAEVAPTTWERLDDGTCEPSVSPTRALYSSQEECEGTGKGEKKPTFTCVHDVRSAMYCEPAKEGTTGECASVEECEASCHITPPPTPAPLPPLPPGTKGVYIDVDFYLEDPDCSKGVEYQARFGTGQCGFFGPPGAAAQFVKIEMTDCNDEQQLAIKLCRDGNCTQCTTADLPPGYKYSSCIPLSATSSETIKCTPNTNTTKH